MPKLVTIIADDVLDVATVALDGVPQFQVEPLENMEISGLRLLLQMCDSFNSQQFNAEIAMGKLLDFDPAPKS